MSFVTIDFLKTLDSNLKNMLVINVMIYKRWLIFLKNIAILSAKVVTFRCILTGISKNEGLKRLNNSVTYDRGVL